MMTSFTVRFVFVAIVLSIYSTLAFAQTGAQNVYIKSVGCSLSGVCYLVVSQESPTGASLQVGPTTPACQSTDIRWNVSTSTAGREALSLLMSAVMAKSKVSLTISTSCHEQGTLFYPTFTTVKVLAP
jgi:hypothetical protein